MSRRGGYNGGSTLIYTGNYSGATRTIVPEKPAAAVAPSMPRPEISLPFSDHKAVEPLDRQTFQQTADRALYLSKLLPYLSVGSEYDELVARLRYVTRSLGNIAANPLDKAGLRKASILRERLMQLDEELSREPHILRNAERSRKSWENSKKAVRPPALTRKQRRRLREQAKLARS